MPDKANIEIVNESHGTENTTTLYNYLRAYICKMQGGKCTNLPRVSWLALLFTTMGSFIGIGTVSLLTHHYHVPLLVPSFGASAVLLYAVCQAPMAQPRNVVGGHIVSAVMGVAICQFLGNYWWTVALGVSLAILGMMATNTLHPPGGATAFVAVYTGQNYEFILAPVALGAVILVITALLVNNLHKERKYPEYWL